MGAISIQKIVTSECIKSHSTLLRKFLMQAKLFSTEDTMIIVLIFSIPAYRNKNFFFQIGNYCYKHLKFAFEVSVFCELS